MDRLVLSQRGRRDLIDLTFEQMEKFFCGNVIELQMNATATMDYDDDDINTDINTDNQKKKKKKKNSSNKKKVVVMSDSAYQGFTVKQRQILEKNGKKLVLFPISETIERIGGGSSRCMIAEIWLPPSGPQAHDLL